MGVSGIMSMYAENRAPSGLRNTDRKQSSESAAREEQRSFVTQRNSQNPKEEMQTRAEMSESSRADYDINRQISSGCPNVPYGFLAKDGVIEYNGVLFVCYERENAICLGDMTNPDDVIRIPLSEGGCLKVNRNCIGQLSKAITMFSPEDIKRILQAISLDTKIQQMKHEIDEEKNSLGKSADAAVSGNANETEHTDESADTMFEEEDEAPSLDKVILLFQDRDTKERTEAS